MQVFDVLIIGAGPAGLSAAIYAARYNRSTLVVNRGIGRIDTHEINQNYLGFPQGIASKKIYDLGQEQAEKFGAVFAADEIIAIEKVDTGFEAKGKRGRYTGRTVILATGVKDVYPNIIDAGTYLGKSLFWCITCDGYKAKGKRVVIAGKDDEAAVTAKQFLNFTKDIIFISNCPEGEVALSQKQLRELERANIPVYKGQIKQLIGHEGWIEKILLDTGKEITTDFLFSEEPARPNNELAKQLGVEINEYGYILTDIEQRTKVAGVYAAGDITEQFSHQVVAAAHEGAEAACAANYDLYRPEQKEE